MTQYKWIATIKVTATGKYDDLVQSSDGRYFWKSSDVPVNIAGMLHEIMTGLIKIHAVGFP